MAEPLENTVRQLSNGQFSSLLDEIIKEIWLALIRIVRINI